jgi:GDP-L-fucose synthase
LPPRLPRRSRYMPDTIFPLKDKRVWVAGETGLVGGALCRVLQARGDCEILSAPRRVVDLTDQKATLDWMEKNRPDCIFLAAAKVGGIGANSAYPADFIRDNLSIALNVIDGAHRAEVKKLLFLGSSCIYPKEAAQPISESALLTGLLEPTNEPYAIAKIAGLKMCQAYRRQYGCDFISAMPTNLYGPGDTFDADNSHVIPAMMVKFKKALAEGAPFVTLWGSGKPLREFLYVDDLARALIVMMERYSGEEPVNIGSGEEISIYDLAHMIADVVGYKGEIKFDSSKPDGAMRKVVDSEKISALKFLPEMALKEGLISTHNQCGRH